MLKSPKYLFEKNENIWGYLYNIINSHRGIILFLDYDGTLVPIKKTPSLAVLSPTIHELLIRLAKKRNLKLVLVSGRSHSDLKSLVRIQNILMVTNHGFRISSEKITWVHPGLKKMLPSLNKFSLLLKRELNNFSGAVVENKKLTLTVHFRNVENHLMPILKNNIYKLLQKYSNKLITTLGKKVIEVRPKIEWNKGKAVLKVLTMIRNREKKYCVIYIGDDKTDEEAFEILDDKAITIRVGWSNNSHAKYYLKNPREVQLFLNKIESLNSIRS